MVVYLDIIWALNLLFDSLLLYLTAIFLKRNISLRRIFAGGFIGSLIILLAFTPVNDYSNHPISKLLFSMMMVLISFGYRRLSFFIKALMTLYAATFLIGGALIGAHYFIQYDSELTASVFSSMTKGFGDPVSWLFVLIGFPIAWYFSKKNIETMEMTKIQFDQIVTVCIKLENSTFRFKGLVDSGNQLYDPLTKLPVMFVSVRNQMDAIPDPIKKIAENPDPIELAGHDFLNEWQNRLRIVPYRVVGQEHQLIAAIKPDHILIDHNGEQYICEKGLVSFTMQQLSADDAFECIVHPKMLTGPKRQGEDVKVS